MKKRCLYIIACMFLFFIFFAFFIEENALVFAFEKEVIEDENEIDTCENVLGNRLDDFIKSSEVPIRNKIVKKQKYMYNLDGTPDYLYVEFENGGYIVFHKSSMTMMEYSMRKRKHVDISKKEYYGGPGVYLVKDGDDFIDQVSNRRFQISVEESKNISDSIRNEILCDGKSVDFNNNLNSNLMYNSFAVEKNDYEYTISDEISGEKPGLDTDNLIIFEKGNGTYIPNFRYFLKKPKHGSNSTGTCGAVAAQLLLSYNNYYSDRRIIDNRYLYGDSNSPEDNPNYCRDPMLMTPKTLGTRGVLENGSDDFNSFFSYVVKKIPANATVNQMVQGIKSILYDRARELSVSMGYDVNSKNGGWFFGTLPVNTSGVKTEIDSGRPAILLMQESLGATNHYIVAYGYSDYQYPNSSESYSGFITHFGWGDEAINVWVNSAWCCSYITLKMEHVHSYSIDVGDIGDAGRRESKCGECGHRTDAFIKFTESSRYVERSLFLAPYEKKDYIISFSTFGDKVFQTFGQKNMQLTLLDSDGEEVALDNGGGFKQNAFFSYNCQPIEYRLRVCIADPSQFGRAKIAITPAYGVSSSSAASLDSFDDIRSFSGTSLNWHSYAQRHRTRIIAFSPSVTGDYTISLESQFDNYLYVIDPGLDRILINGTDFDDDSGDGLNAKINRRLIAERTYLIIYSQFNPSSYFTDLDAGDDVYVRIKLEL